MTTPRPTPDPLTSPEAWQQQSMLYLLGELDATQRKFVEQQLESFPELGEELLRQAEVIAGLSDAAFHPPLADAAAGNRGLSAWPLVTSIAAVAACIAVLVFGVQLNTSDRDTLANRPESTPRISQANHLEDLLIARAWANHQHDAGDDLELVEPDVDEAIAIVSEDDSLDHESTLSWMFMAVSANSESLAEGVTNDG